MFYVIVFIIGALAGVATLLLIQVSSYKEIRYREDKK